eukprot:CAMPEP_0119300176 /NCGR_PEP_ID=MMETSP1333-20130426/2175_1 /TAXON_ID=418940 /ORGANISM="Scyphosphaera apsteinii, Strain RCC1455" /LENGTH=492 /DNA_ID=CAMNT_0007301863 /DNA_START=189 /DNA_END=1667 /DNA_ORIENTATION=-
MKRLNKDALLASGTQATRHAVQENNILVDLAKDSQSCPFICELRFASQDALHVYLLVDYIGGGDLFQFLESYGALPEEWICIYAGEICLALEFLHNRSIVFGDLKPENVMVCMSGHLKLIDFGISQRLFGQEGSELIGTFEYMAPEVLRINKDNKKYDATIDWWALGCLMFEMFANTGLFNVAFGLKELQRCACGAGLPLRFQEGMQKASIELRSLILALLVSDPTLRLGAPPDGALGIRAHPFFSKLDFNRLQRNEVPAPCMLHSLTTAKHNVRSRPRSQTWLSNNEMLERDFLTFPEPAGMTEVGFTDEMWSWQNSPSSLRSTSSVSPLAFRQTLAVGTGVGAGGSGDAGEGGGIGEMEPEQKQEGGAERLSEWEADGNAEKDEGEIERNNEGVRLREMARGVSRRRHNANGFSAVWSRNSVATPLDVQREFAPALQRWIQRCRCLYGVPPTRAVVQASFEEMIANLLQSEEVTEEAKKVDAIIERMNSV